jgi:hypothetical protein
LSTRSDIIDGATAEKQAYGLLSRWFMAIGMAIAFAACALVAAAANWMFKESVVEPQGLQYALLVPDEMSREALAQLGKLTHYRLSPGDGPKPSTVTAVIQTSASLQIALAGVEDFATARGFARQGHGAWRRGETQLEWHAPPTCQAACMLEITWIDD